MKSKKKAKIEYRPEIDGLRAIAVLAVIVYHAPTVTINGFSLFKGGYLGVDIFFVISGYLITSIIIKEIKQYGSFSFKNFYERRIRRIIPVLFFVVLISFYFSYLFLLPTNLIDYSRSSLSTLFFGSNFYFYFLNLDYSQFTGLKKPLLHTWSLSIEEQFYIFYPAVLLITYKKFNKHFIPILWAIFLISFLISVIQTEKNQILSFYSIHSRIWEFCLGALASIYIFKKKLNFSNSFKIFAPLLGIILIFFSLILIDHKYKHPSYFTLLPTLGTFLIILFSSKNDLVTKTLSSKVLVSIGLISYSLYMWHYPIFAYADLVQFVEGYDIGKNLFTITFFIFLIFTISIFSYFFLERPFRNKTLKFKHVSLILMSVLAICIFLNFYTLKNEGKINSENTNFESLIKNTMVNQECKFYSDKKDNFFNEKKQRIKFEKCKKKYKKFVLVIGDSHAGNLYNAIAKSSDYEFILGLIKHACRPSKKEKCQFDAAENFISSERTSIKQVIVTHKGSFFLTNTGNPNNENFTFARKLPIVKNEVNATLKFLIKINKIIPVIFVGPHIEPNIFLSKKNITTIMNGELDKFKDNQNFDLINVDKYLEKVMKEKGIRYISKIKQLNFNLKQDYVVNNKLTFKDIGHWSDFGEIYFGEKLVENIYLKNLKK